MKSLQLMQLDANLTVFVMIVACVVMFIVQLLSNIVMNRRHHQIRKELEHLKSQKAETSQPEGKEVLADKHDSSEDQALFLRLDQLLEQDRLYCDPMMGRDTLCRLIDVDKNRLGSIITHYSGSANSTAYINRKRMQYAIELMREHPDWTMMRIAEACGIRNTSTFNRVFRQTYGTTPTEYIKKSKK